MNHRPARVIFSLRRPRAARGLFAPELKPSYRALSASTALAALLLSLGAASFPAPALAINISSCQTITDPGAYDLTGSIGNGAECLVIAADGVTIDGHGYTVSSDIGSAINASAVAGNGHAVNLQNMHVSGAIVANGATGSGSNGGDGGAVTLSNVTVSSNIDTNGGECSGQNGLAGGRGGDVVMASSTAASITTNGGTGCTGTTAGDGTQPGSVFGNPGATGDYPSGTGGAGDPAPDPATGNIGGTGGAGGNGGRGGDVILNRATIAGNMNSFGGTGGTGGTGGQGSTGGNTYGGSGGQGGQGADYGEGYGDGGQGGQGGPGGSANIAGGAGGDGGPGGPGGAGGDGGNLVYSNSTFEQMFSGGGTGGTGGQGGAPGVGGTSYPGTGGAGGPGGNPGTEGGSQGPTGPTGADGTGGAGGASGQAGSGGSSGASGNSGGLSADSTRPIVSLITSDAPDGTYGVGETIAIFVTFSETVTSTGNVTLTLETGATDRTCVFNVSVSAEASCSYTVQAGDASPDLNVSSISGTVKDLALNEMTQTLPASNLAENKDITILDTQAPVVTNVTSSTANGTYNAGDVVSIQVAFDETVSVDTGSGAPTLTLWAGVTRDATFVSVSTNVVNFSYTVQEGDTATDLDYADAGAFEINGASIADVAGNAADLTLPASGQPGSLGANKDIVVDTTAPDMTNVSFNLTGPSDTGNSSNDGVTSVTSPDFVVVNCENTATVSFKEGNSVLVTEVCGSEFSGQAYATSPSLSGGAHTFIVTQTDTAGNISASSSPFAVVVDTIAPTLSLTTGSSSPVAGAFPVFLTSSEAIDYLALGDILVGNGTAGTLTSTTSSAYRFVVTPTADGAVTVRVGTTTIIDIAGNENPSASNQLSLAADLTAPSVSLDAPANGATVSGSVSLEASASDANLAGVQFRVDGADEGAEDTDGTYGVTWDSTGVADGSHTVAAVARDGAGNYATSTVTVTVSNAAANPGPAPSNDGQDSERHSSSGRRGGSSGSSGSGEGPSSGSSPAGSSSSGGGFSRDLGVGSSGGDVRDLQRFLNARGFTVAASGAGSPGSETDLFGGLTRDALARFQAANGVAPAAGYLGPKTRALIEALGGGDSVPASTPDVPAPNAPARDLDLGAEGGDVAALQALLVARAAGPAAAALAGAGPSGHFGPLTQAALAELQRALGVSPATGYYGAKTRAALGL